MIAEPKELFCLMKLVLVSFLTFKKCSLLLEINFFFLHSTESKFKTSWLRTTKVYISSCMYLVQNFTIWEFTNGLNTVFYDSFDSSNKQVSITGSESSPAQFKNLRCKSAFGPGGYFPCTIGTSIMVTLLWHMSNMRGKSSSRLYIGARGTTFPFHIDNESLVSISYFLVGCSKV